MGLWVNPKNSHQKHHLYFFHSSNRVKKPNSRIFLPANHDILGQCPILFINILYHTKPQQADMKQQTKGEPWLVYPVKLKGKQRAVIGGY